MTFADVPDIRPYIEGVQREYQSHQQVNLNCSSPRSKPPANLTFYINDEPVIILCLSQYAINTVNSIIDTVI